MMMEAFNPDLSVGNILCCVCGVSIPPNPSNKCANCLRAQVDITESISRQNILIFCRGCERYLQPPRSWVTCDLESPELLTICLKTLKGLNKVRLIEAKFIWTEPHSRRVIVRLTVQKEVLGAILQQEFDVVFVVKTQQCDTCTRAMAHDTWNAVVQMRQKVDHKRTFLYLEQLIIKHKAQKDCLRIKSFPDGIDFYFNLKQHAIRFAQFIQDFVPTRMKESEQLISQDFQSNTSNSKYAMSLEILPVCRDDLVFLPPQVSRKCGSISQLCVVSKVTQSIHLMDPDRMTFSECTGSLYWSHPFTVLGTAADMVEFQVIDSVPSGPIIGKHQKADVTLRRSNRMGDSEVLVRSHLGAILNPGDFVLGFDLESLNYGDALHGWKGVVPDVIVVRKTFPQSRKRLERRKMWTMKHLDAEQDESEMKKDVEDRRMRDEEIFTRTVEEDKEYRQNFALFKAQKKAHHRQSAVAAEVMPGMNTEIDEEDEGEEDSDDLIGLDELIDDLEIDGGEQAEDPELRNLVDSLNVQF